VHGGKRENKGIPVMSHRRRGAEIVVKEQNIIRQSKKFRKTEPVV
jgi:hypothetical protein